MTAAQDGTVDRWSMPTAVHAAPGCLAGLRSIAEPLTFVDAAIPERADLHRGQVVPLDAADFVGCMAEAAAAMAAHPGRPIVAAGGGTVLDAVRLAELTRRDPAFAAALADSGPGVLVWPRMDPSPVIAVPTTIGTAAEVSPVASVPGPTMVVSPALRCRMALLDPGMTASLQPRQQGAGLIEPFARAVVPAVTSDPLPLQDRLAAAHAQTLFQLGRDFQRGRVDQSWLLSAALTSTSTHTAFLALGRAPAGHVLWPFATELMGIAGLDKAAALARLLPAWLDVVAAGVIGEAFGTRERVEAILGPVPQVRAWLEGLGQDTAPVVADPGQLAKRVRDTWQGPLFLPGVPAADIDVLAQAVCA